MLSLDAEMFASSSLVYKTVEIDEDNISRKIALL